MSKTGPIIIIEDDPDDQEMIHRVLSKLNLENELKKFYDGEEALNYFLHTTEKPMIILCDINMPLMNGIELKQNIESNEMLRKKSIPFIYLTTTANADQIAKAYNLTVQGFFAKGQSYGELKETLIQIVTYWKRCEHPL
jgi:CheY-like chemotaxis protein